MATIICPGCFDIFHEGHRRFLHAASRLGGVERHTLIVAVNTDDSAIALKRDRWGPKYPINHVAMRVAKVHSQIHLDVELEVVPFDSEERLREIIRKWMPCIIAKGPDYVGKQITGEEIAPVILINTPETEPIRQMKRDTYR